MTKTGRPATVPGARRSEKVAVYLTPAEKAAALRIAGAAPLASWVYGLVRAQIEQEGATYVEKAARS